MSVRVYGRGDSPPLGVDTIAVNATSSSRDPFYRRLSPFFLGPVSVKPFETTYTSRNMENAWQYSKLYAAYSERPDWKQAYLDWAQDGWNKERAVRFPMGPGAKPVCSLVSGDRVGYVEARIRLYAPLYARCVQEYAPDVLEHLRKLVFEQGKTVAIFDYDGYDHVSNAQSLRDVLYNERRKMGHGFVLAMLIQGNEPWKDGFDASLVHSTPIKSRVRPS